jgi:hypothetical protein
VALPRLEVDGDLVDEKIERLDAAKAPTLVHDESAWSELLESRSGGGSQGPEATAFLISEIMRAQNLGVHRGGARERVIANRAAK